jgi:serine/threonine protein phosphatase PrpC
MDPYNTYYGRRPEFGQGYRESFPQQKTFSVSQHSAAVFGSSYPEAGTTELGTRSISAGLIVGGREKADNGGMMEDAGFFGRTIITIERDGKPTPVELYVLVAADGVSTSGGYAGSQEVIDTVRKKLPNLEGSDFLDSNAAFNQILGEIYWEIQTAMNNRATQEIAYARNSTTGVTGEVKSTATSIMLVMGREGEGHPRKVAGIQVGDTTMSFATPQMQEGGGIVSYNNPDIHPHLTVMNRVLQTALISRGFSDREVYWTIREAQRHNYDTQLLRSINLHDIADIVEDIHDRAPVHMRHTLGHLLYCFQPGRPPHISAFGFELDESGRRYFTNDDPQLKNPSDQRGRLLFLHPDPRIVPSGTLLMVGTDGVYDNVSPQELVEIVNYRMLQLYPASAHNYSAKDIGSNIIRQIISPGNPNKRKRGDDELTIWGSTR